MSSPYSLGADTKLPQIDPQVLMLGMKALQSGAVPIQTAMAAFHNSPYSVGAQGPANKDGKGPDAVPAAGPLTDEATGAENSRVNGIIAAQHTAQAVANQRQVMDQNSPTQQQQPGMSLKPVVPGSGMKEGLESDQNKKQTTTETRATLLKPDDVKQGDDRLENLSAFKNLMAGQGDLENQLNMERDKKPGMDWRPLAALGDAWAGGHVADSLPKQETAQERAKRLFEAAQKIQGDRKSIVDTYFNNIKSLKGGALVDQLMQTEQLKHTLGAEDPNKGPDRQAKSLQALARSVTQDTKEFKDSNASLVEAQNLLASKNSIPDTVFRDKFLKALIGGRVTNYDLMRQSGDTSLADKAEQFIESAINGKFTPHNRGEYQAAINIIQQANQHELAARLKYWNSVGTDSYQLDKGRVDPITNLEALSRAPVAEKALQQTRANSAKIINHAQGNDDVRIQLSDGRIVTGPSSRAQAVLARDPKARVLK